MTRDERSGIVLHRWHRYEYCYICGHSDRVRLPNVMLQQGRMSNLERAKGITYVPIEAASGPALMPATQNHGPQIPNSDVQRRRGCGGDDDEGWED